MHSYSHDINNIIVVIGKFCKIFENYLKLDKFQMVNETEKISFNIIDFFVLFPLEIIYDN